jgi:tetratricopeptide (TPR) repeat protein
MVETRRRPSAQELEALIDAFRRDPASAYVRLGEAYIALDRPRDAVEVAAIGLRDNPDDIDGRVMVSRALMMLHQWKEAQVELLRVVKVDRSHRDGFCLLGEVLMRRNDFERALPVLQHAQNLDPANPSILAMLKRARAGRALDPAPPVPDGAAAPARHRISQPPPGFDEEPTRSVDDAQPGLGLGSDDNLAQLGDDRLGRMQLAQLEVQRSRAPVERAARRSDPRGEEMAAPRAVERHAPPPAEDPFRPLTGELDPSRPRRPSAPPMAAMAHASTSQQPGVRPRILPQEKPRDAAHAPLRQSVAVGEEYLNNLLTSGLLHVPSVPVAEVKVDVNPDARWGRSALRMFVYLFALLLVSTAGGGGWYWYTARQRDADVARHLDVARRLRTTGHLDDLTSALSEARSAIDRDRERVESVAVFASVAGLDLLLYGTVPPEDVDLAVGSTAKLIRGPQEPGYRDLLIGRAAAVLAALPQAEEPVTRLAELRTELDTWLAGHADDHLLRWLQGQALLAAGDRDGARAAFEQAAARGEGPPLALLSLADLGLDDGQFAEAARQYQQVLERAPRHPLAFLGRSMALSERSGEPAEALGDLSVGIPQPKGTRLIAYTHLAMAQAKMSLEDYDDAARALDKAAGVAEPRFLARVALARIRQGELAAAAKARARITWYADKPAADPLVTVVDAELLLSRAVPEAALAAVGKRRDMRSRKVRAKALFELGKTSEALEELTAALEVAPDDLELQAWADATKLAAERGRGEAAASLDRLGRQAKNKAIRYIQGVALLRAGDLSAGRDKLEQSLDKLGPETPNGLAYRARAELAYLDLRDGKLDAAEAKLKAVLEANPGYLPAHGLMARVLLSRGQARQAMQHLEEVLSAQAADAGVELAYAEALARVGGGADAGTRAREAMRRAGEKGASGEEMARVAELVDGAFGGGEGRREGGNRRRPRR